MNLKSCADVVFFPCAPSLVYLLDFRRARLTSPEDSGTTGASVQYGSSTYDGLRADPVQVPFAVERRSVARVSRTARSVQEIDPDLGALPQSSEILPGMQISQRSLTVLVDFSADSSVVTVVWCHILPRHRASRSCLR